MELTFGLRDPLVQRNWTIVFIGLMHCHVAMLRGKSARVFK